MTPIAAIRPDSVNLPLFLHVFGAMVLMGTLFAVVLAIALSTRDGSAAVGLRRLALKTVVMGVLPSFIVMRVAAQWTVSEENLPPAVEDQTWLTIGYITGELGIPLVLASVVLAAVGLKRLRTEGAGDDAGAGQARAVQVIGIIMIVAYLVTIWARAAKPE